MRWLIFVLLLLGAHFSLTALVPGQAGRALIYWPFAKDTQPTLAILGSAAKPITQLLSVLAGSCFLVAAAANLGWLIPPAWFAPAVVLGAVSSIALFVLYIGSNAVIPVAIGIFLLWGVLVQKWTAMSLRGG